MESKQQPLLLVIAGNDSYVSDVVRPWVAVLSHTPRGLDAIRAGIVPVGRDVDVSQQIMSVDNVYRSLFFTPEWDQLFGPTATLTASEGALFDSRVSKYIQDAAMTHHFQIGEAFITSATGGKESKSVPFIRGVELGVPAEVATVRRRHKMEVPTEASADAAAVLLQLDYWNTAPGGKKEAEKVSAKMHVQYLATVRLGVVAAQLFDGAVMPTDKTLALVAKMAKEKKLPFSTRQKSEIVKARIEKIVCSSADESGFEIVIDGVHMRNVRFVSMSATWMSHVKTIPVACFVDLAAQH
eukprot:TRINITY_DN5127_c0_g1_i1.p1 TRINITY_DN5127_c0_g1~~TRINITY_DN5127_c0_g1_i1.p1  ORF type:complete len:297 (+),score=81.74 TRINITY_DN5127_c0_g1_i1:123-1013(+)